MAHGRGEAQRLGNQVWMGLKVNLTEKGGTRWGKGPRGSRARLGGGTLGRGLPRAGPFPRLEGPRGGTNVGARPT